MTYLQLFFTYDKYINFNLKFPKRYLQKNAQKHITQPLKFKNFPGEGAPGPPGRFYISFRISISPSRTTILTWGLSCRPSVRQQLTVGNATNNRSNSSLQWRQGNWGEIVSLKAFFLKKTVEIIELYIQFYSKLFVVTVSNVLIRTVSL